ncbi:MAG: type II 3-dehydroquinate dehydratase [Gammaproteobacteria bacterium]|nr:type II 3-dehydroquinate dehydratase [Gammaproteobacteria bacterium]MCY4226169.1 type II 3-dehydroquinate dehydratase [Gammaproteobacteria bacterium]MCY4313006.1 type II 3-dehydroquinate dehydratase [Gammaproteobacteria bacterium]
MRKFLVLNGPNLNLLGRREPELYGDITLDELEDILLTEAEKLKTALECRQSNSESQLVDWIHQADDDEIESVIINPGAYTHTSIALRDAFLATDMHFIEVHMTNIFAREEFRHKSYLSDIADATIVGMGFLGYMFALHYAIVGTADPDNLANIFEDQ